MNKRMKLMMREQGVHPHVWSYCLIYETDVYNRILKAENNQAGWEAVNGDTPDISEYLEFFVLWMGLVLGAW